METEDIKEFVRENCGDVTFQVSVIVEILCLLCRKLMIELVGF